ncbi:MAG TPA: hypothetical protein ACFYEC_01545 [Candidatus Brocadiaceae bacterium]
MFKYEYVPLDQLKSNVSAGAELQPGTAEFKITAIWETDNEGKPLVTKEFIPKIKVALLCIDCKGNSGRVYHDISAKMQWALLGLGESIGRPVYNESGTTDWKSLVGAMGKCVLENRQTPGWPMRTVVKNYLPLTGVMARPVHNEEPLATPDPFDDMIPF